jgi:hypothetical protein
MEMNPQQKEFLEMSEEFSEPDECSETDVLQVGYPALTNRSLCTNLYTI